MADRKTHIPFQTVSSSAIRNWFVDTVVEFGLDEYKIDPNTGQLREEYLQLMDLLKRHTEASRAAVIAFAQTLHEAWHLIPYSKLPFDKYPWLERAMDFGHEQFKAACEQLPDTMRAYAARQQIEYPEGFQPWTTNEAIKKFFEWLKDRITASPGEVFTFITRKLPELAENTMKKIFGRAVSLPGLGGDSRSALASFANIRENHPELFAQVVDAVAELAMTNPEIEGTLSRINPEDVNEAVAKKVVSLQGEERIKFLKFLAKDTLLEKAGKLIDNALKPLEDVFEHSASARKSRQDARAARRAQRDRNSATGSVMPMNRRQ